MTTEVLPGSCSGVSVKRPGYIGAWHKHGYNAFTLIELVVVFGLILVLTGLVLSTVGYARKKGARARAETEIAALSAACESYKSDNAVYPSNSDTNALDPRSDLDPSAAVYSSASLFLYEQLSGDLAHDRQPSGKSYFAFKPNMLLPPGGSGMVTAISDPFGNSYGYSTTANPQANPTPTGTPGYNPTFDLWSTAGVAPSPTPAPPATQQDLWIKNW
jgi:type II secretory pathway pseudopilin PulG